MSTGLYWVGVKAYELAIRIAAPWNEKAAAAVQGRRGLLQKIESAMKADTRPRIWMHCASLGEFEQGRPVLEALREKYPTYVIVLTFFSPSGYNVRKEWEGADYIFYLPFDAPRESSRFVKAVRPSLAIFVKYEFWYYLLRSLKQANVPTILIAAIFHPQAPFFQVWGALYRRMLRYFSHIFVQDEASKKLLSGVGANNVAVAGDPRYDRVLAAAKTVEGLPKAKAFAATGFTLVAGSTWPSDETLLKKAFDLLPEDVRLILVPHEVGASHLQEIESHFKNESVRWSRWQEGSQARVLIVDTIGLLVSLYPYGQAAYVGGGFDKAGVHNVLEPAAYGKPIMMGPMYKKYREAVQLEKAGGAIVVQDAVSLVSQITPLKEDDKHRSDIGNIALKEVQLGAGGTAQIMHAIEQAGYLC